jgi:hypothetical protein
MGSSPCFHTFFDQLSASNVGGGGRPRWRRGRGGGPTWKRSGGGGGQPAVVGHFG